MAITKTRFINYTRCPRYVALDEVKKEKMEADVTSFDREEEIENLKKDVLSNMFDTDGTDLIDTKNEHLETMMPYYNQIEILAGYAIKEKFDGKATFSKYTKGQESFTCNFEGMKLLCYVDVFLDKEDGLFDVFEVKATTTKKFLSLGNKINKVMYSIFEKNDKGIYKLLEELQGSPLGSEYPVEKYNKAKEKLYDRFHPAGKYVYDLAVQRFIIENYLKQSNQEHLIDKINFYLVVLNSEYVFDGKKENGKPKYTNDIISFIDLTKFTKGYMDKVKLDAKRVKSYILNGNLDKTDLGIFCERKKTTQCKFYNICYKDIPATNSIFNFHNFKGSFKSPLGEKYTPYELANMGKVNLLDIDPSWLSSPRHQRQYEVTKTGIPYVDKKKIKDGIAQIEYPIYHLDFESFPCPLPNFEGEKCYSQSLFQFSIHIEKEEGVCDKEKDHYEFLAKDHNDNRKQLIEDMLSYIDVNSKGTVLVYNQAFEKTRIKELGEIFPLYKKDLQKLNNMIFDLMYLVNTNSALYKDLGYNDLDAKMFNYYNKDLTGSYSIKKILPIFSNLTYKGMDVGNGVDAMIAYASYPNLSDKEKEFKINSLIKYCQQDTWAMVEILWNLKKLIKS